MNWKALQRGEGKISLVSLGPWAASDNKRIPGRIGTRDERGKLMFTSTGKIREDYKEGDFVYNTNRQGSALKQRC
jgi:hypothetical protein